MTAGATPGRATRRPPRLRKPPSRPGRHRQPRRSPGIPPPRRRNPRRFRPRRRSRRSTCSAPVPTGRSRWRGSRRPERRWKSCSTVR
ncbi:hypothetical protein D2T33_07585 [Sinirhodobacter populi]|uniref:Uncharacterized protein n=1 Tax=Paenirhodobacter populi TaxID=2306993 RepID=A0A451GCJ4_9RHOB|nr:hypothetical protein D2T33_07585 [Sinirhodobacter populi]